MVQQIINAAPMMISYGTNDLSKRVVPYQKTPIPQHLPKFYLYTQKGPTTSQFISPNDLVRVYGGDSFDFTKPWFNHATVFAQAIAGQGNSLMVQRVVPQDAGPNANIVLWMDVLKTKVDLYQRNSDGSIAFDAMNDPIVVGQTDGYKVKWIYSNKTSMDDVQTPGNLTQMSGDQTDPDTGEVSTRYPMFELRMAWQGAYGNNVGIRLWSPNYATDNNLPGDLFTTSRVYPFYLSVVSRTDDKSPVSIVNTRFADTKVLFTLKENTPNPYTTAETYLPDVYEAQYNNPLTGVTPEFDNIYVYQNNIDELLGKFHTSESNHLDVFSDMTADATDKYLFNIIGLTSSHNVQYATVQFVDSNNSLMLSRFSNVFANAGSDGTMTNDLFSSLVRTEITRYANPDDYIQDMTLNPESIFYDSGFDLATKKVLASFISQRKDTFLVLSTFDVDGPTLSTAEEYSVGAALKSFVQLYPESDYFGTPVMRGLVMSGSSNLLNSNYKKRVPQGIEIAIKSAKYMGASTAAWKSTENFDSAPGNILRYTYNHSQTWLPATARNSYWSVGVNWIQAYDFRSFHFPALKTVYGSDAGDDTSVLNSYFTAMAICYLNKVAFNAWKEFTGTSSLSEAQLVQRVNEFVNKAVKDKFDGRFVIVPDAQFDELDTLRGYSWHLPIRIYANNMKTVMTTYVEAYRMSDLTAPTV